MTILLTILAVIGGLLLLMLILAAFFKNEYTIQREIIINRPKQEVFDYVKQMKNQDQYSKWVRMDPEAKKEYRGTDGAVGFVYAWDSKNKQAGKGEQEIKAIVEGETIDVEVRFERPFKNTARTPIFTETVSNGQTKVRWGMSGQSKYPMNLMNPLMDNLLGKDMEVSLADLKTILESK